MLSNDLCAAGFLMHDVSRLMRTRFDARVREFGVTRPQWRVLLHLARTPGMTQAGLSEQLDVEQITLCRMIDRLADAGLVERRSDPRDRRVRRLHLLDPALPIVERLARVAAELEEEVLADLSADDRRILIASLGRMRDGIRRTAGDEAGRQVA